MLQVVVIIALLALFYLLHSIYRDKTGFSLSTTRWVRRFHWAIFSALLLLIALSRNNIYLSGYWSPKVLFWIWFLLALCLNSFGRKEAMNKPERIFYKSIFLLPLIFIPIAFIPFAGAGIALFIFSIVIGDRDMILYSSPHVRIEKRWVQYLGPEPANDVFIRQGIFAYKVYSYQLEGGCLTDTVIVDEHENGTITIKTVYSQYDERKDTLYYQITPGGQ